MNDTSVMDLFARAGAIVTDSHFVYSSGRHSSVYINKDALYLHTSIISQLCARMAAPYDPQSIDTVVGPALGGIVLSQWVTYYLNNRRIGGETVSVYAEKEGGDGPDKRFVFHRGYDAYISGKNVLVVEDILTTGASARKVVELVRSHGGNVVGLSALCNRGNVIPEDVADASIHSVAKIGLQTYAGDDCPFCEQGIPVNTLLGKGRAFLVGKRQR